MRQKVVSIIFGAGELQYPAWDTIFKKKKSETVENPEIG